MVNPAAALKAVKAELTENPELVREWNKLADTDPEAVREAMIRKAAEHDIKLTKGQLKLAAKAGKPFLSKLGDNVRGEAQELFSKLF